MRLLIGAVTATALAVGAFFQVGQASAQQATPRIERPDKATTSDISARHRHYHHRYHRHARYYRAATLPYDGYRPYPPPPPCYRSCASDWTLPYFGRGW